MSKDMDSIKAIALSLDMELPELLQQAIPGILPHVLPHFAPRANDSGDKLASKKRRHANACYSMLVEVVQQEVSIEMCSPFD